MTNPVQMIQAFNNFKNSFSGNPKETVEKLLQSGQMSQQQYNALQQQAGQFQQLINNFKL